MELPGIERDELDPYSSARVSAETGSKRVE
jgi:hypothetical protein